MARPAKWAATTDDNDGGGNDNYPAVLSEMTVEEQAEGRGCNRQK